MKNYYIIKQPHQDRFIYLLYNLLKDMRDLQYSWLHGTDDYHIKDLIAKILKKDVDKFTLTIQTKTSAHLI